MRATTRGATLRDEACPACGRAIRERKGRLKLPVNGEEITVPDATHLRCSRCRQVVLRFDDARRLRQRALEIYRTKYGLLSADEIRSIRARFGLTQTVLARLRRLGGNTISRWESGRNVQSDAAGARAVLFRLRRRARLVRPEVVLRLSRDSTDDKFLECAVAGGADYVVSADGDLLGLREVHGIPILDAPTFWQTLSAHRGQP